eukprot:GHVO01002212.1.p1 GENE.GHVO01002212.1~~GHVO01002212.1.p1  ORF type:complete len:652 (-),score=17.37 GHVO01002212.1:359-2272(-)
MDKLKTMYSNEGVLGGLLTFGTGEKLTDDVSELNPLYRKIFEEFQTQYESIGNRQSDEVLGRAKLTGGLDHIGINYAHEFGTFNVFFKRQLAPDLFDDERWIVTDEMEIIINASKLLSNLKDKEVLDISKKQLGYFAGVNFKRSFRFVHFANSYQEGLTLDFHKLFLGFSHFSKKNYLRLSPYEFIQREDNLSVSVAGLAHIPIVSGISGSVGAMAKYSRMEKVDIQMLGEGDNPRKDEIMRVSYEKEKGVEAGASASLQADFLGLLRITLLSMDVSYSYEEKNRVYLSFYKQDMPLLSKMTKLSNELERLLKGKGVDAETFKKNIVTYEKRKSETKKTKYLALLFGGMKDQKTQLVEVVTDGKLKKFFRHYYEKIKYRQNFMSRFVSILLKSFLKLDSIVSKDYSDSRNVTIEYDSEKDLVSSKEDINIEKEGKLSVAFKEKYYSRKIQGRLGKKHQNKVISMLEGYSGVDPYAVSLMKSGALRGPVNLTANYRVNDDAIKHFTKLSRNDVYSKIKKTCGVKSRGIFSFFRNLFNFCKYKMYRSYDKFYNEYSYNDVYEAHYKTCKRKVRKYFFRRRKRRVLLERCLQSLTYKREAEKLQLPLWRFKDISQHIFVESRSKVDIYNFYGVNNVFSFW